MEERVPLFSLSREDSNLLRGLAVLQLLLTHTGYMGGEGGLVLFLIVLPASHLLGWAGNMVKHIGSLQGSSYGFKSPNSLAAFLVLAVSVGLYLTRERRWAVVCAICWPAAALTFLLTLSRTQVLLLVALPLLLLFLQKFRPKPWLLAALPFACLALSVLLAIHYGPGYGTNTFESRFSIPALVYEKYGLSPFGQECGLRNWFKGVYPYRLAIDNGYLALLLCRGVFICLAALAVMAHLLYLVGKKGDALLTAMACCMTVLGMMEGIPFFVKFSFLPLLYVPLLEELEPEGRKITLPVAFVLAFSILTFMFMPWHPRRDLPHPYGTLADIPVPAGFEKELCLFHPDTVQIFAERDPFAALEDPSQISGIKAQFFRHIVQ